jgi:hypothetical protein
MAPAPIDITTSARTISEVNPRVDRRGDKILAAVRIAFPTYPASASILLVNFRGNRKARRRLINNAITGSPINAMIVFKTPSPNGFPGSIFNYRLEGEYEGVSFDNKSFNWDGRWNNTLSFTKTTQMQINTYYNNPSATAQGEYKGNISTDASMKQSLLERKLSVILQLRDVFGTAKREFTSSVRLQKHKKAFQSPENKN